MPCPKSPKVSWLDKVKFIKHYAMDTCSTTWQVYVETGTNADMNLVLNLAGVSNTEAVYTLLRPKQGRIERHGGGRGKKNSRYGKWSKLNKITKIGEEAIPDSAELIAENVKLLGDWERPVYSEVGTYLFDIARPIIRGAYYLTMVNAATDFAYDWYSGILLAPQSKCNIGRYSIGVSRLAIPLEGYVRLIPVVEAFHPIGSSWSEVGVSVDNGSWTVIFVLAIDTDHSDFHTGKVFMKLMLGVDAPTQCGRLMEVDVDADQGLFIKKFVWKITAPDTFNIHAAYVSDTPFSLINYAFSGVQGFRI